MEVLNRHQIESLARFAEGMDEGELRDLIHALTARLSDGYPVTLIANDTDYTPAQVAERLRMSRTHLYKLLDSGEIPSHRVGRDRRIAGRDVITFERRRQAEHRALTERFANAEAIRRAAIDELASEL
ncbi:helix-turn-helix domain-containing protein [Actinomyces oricola]|uniref:helix-turn-helix domain-containing protein n=1 Tax=Actinomyces oricola TaxID=206043 RepID=UPI000FFF2938|nr:helix-turn-helix domain-containing protein [Actinomyces oricola]